MKTVVPAKANNRLAASGNLPPFMGREASWPLQQSSPLGPDRNKINSVLILTHSLIKMHCNIVLQSTCTSPTCHEGTEGEWRYSSTLSLTSALDGMGG
jgi:hypothetical protein